MRFRFVFSVVVLSLLYPSWVFSAAEKDFENLYGQLLRTYWHPQVSIHGVKTTVFDYKSMAVDAKKEISIFNKIDDALEKIDLTLLGREDSVKAFWINVYNYAAMRLVIKNYPVDSIRSLKISLLKYPWAIKSVRVGSELYSLKKIEKEMLLEPFLDNRIVFAVSCAAVSCPDRIIEPFTAENINDQLDRMIRTFFSNNKKGLYYDKTKQILTLSWILEKDEALFSNAGGVLEFVKGYVDPDTLLFLTASSVTVRFFDHDWTLNDLDQSDNEKKS